MLLAAEERCLEHIIRAEIPDLRVTLDEPRAREPGLALKLQILYESVEKMKMFIR